MWKHARRLSGWFASVGTVLVVFSTYSIPKTVADADGIIFANLKWLGWSQPPSTLATNAVDHILLLTGIGLIAFGAICFALWVNDRSRKADIQRLSVDSEVKYEAPSGIRVSGNGRVFVADSAIVSCGDGVFATENSSADIRSSSIISGYTN